MAIQNITSNEFVEMLDENKESLEIIDIREPYEHERIHIKGSKLIPLSIISWKITEVDWTKKVILVCASGARSSHIASLLSRKGKNVLNLEGGIHNLNMLGCPCLVKNQ